MRYRPYRSYRTGYNGEGGGGGRGDDDGDRTHTGWEKVTDAGVVETSVIFGVFYVIKAFSFFGQGSAYERAQVHTPCLQESIDCGSSIKKYPQCNFAKKTTSGQVKGAETR